jgi:hypothetical protein
MCDKLQSDEPVRPDDHEKCFRCGWCGSPTDKNGVVLTPEQIEKSSLDYDFAESVHGDCCAGQKWLENENEMQQITREMAMDAGDMSLEGQYI